jgi:hypothetical protein
MPEGRLKNSFLDRSNSSREEKPPKSTELVACSEKPQLRSFSFPNTLQIVEVGVSRKAEIQEEFGEGRYGNFLSPFQCPRNDNFLTHLKCPTEERNCSLLIPSARSSVKDSISPMHSGNSVSCEHPEIFKHTRDFECPID